MNLTKYMFASLILSLLLHLFLMLAFAGVSIKSPLPYPTEERHNTQPISIKLFDAPKPLPQKLDTQTKNDNKIKAEKQLDDGKNKLKMQSIADPKISTMFDNKHLTAPMPRPTVRMEKLERATIKPAVPTVQTVVSASAPRPEIIEIDASKLPVAVLKKREVITPKLERHDVPEVKLPSLLPVGPSVKGTAPTYDIGLRFSAPQIGGPAIIPEDPVTNDPGNGIPELKPDNKQHPVLVPRDPTLPEGSNGPIESFEKFVDLNVVVKEDNTTGGGYFMACISANKFSNSIREIPKDVMIIIDRSSSISPKKFKAFKEASKEALEYLSRYDGFNIVTFTDKAYALSSQCIPAVPENIARAQKFISGLNKGGTTDVFDALAPFVKMSPSKIGRPLNIFLLTDGVSTVNIYKDDVFLREITHINPGHVSIFPFSAGNDANRELLDFLGFLNRGQNMHANSIEDINNDLSAFITDHSNILIRDIEYWAHASLVNEIFPKKLQHLYRGSDVRIYGKYGPSDTELFLNVIGFDSQNIRRDVMFRCNFQDCQKTSMDIDKQWASNKIMHLLADRTLAFTSSDKRAIEAQIRKLSQEFNLAIPY